MFRRICMLGVKHTCQRTRSLKNIMTLEHQCKCCFYVPWKKHQQYGYSIFAKLPKCTTPTKTKAMTETHLNLTEEREGEKIVNINDKMHEDGNGLYYRPSKGGTGHESTAVCTCIFQIRTQACYVYIHVNIYLHTHDCTCRAQKY